MSYSFHHIALSVSNRKASLEFYGKLGFEEFHTWSADDNSLTIIHLKKDGLFLELFCYTNYTLAPETIHTTSTDLPVIGTKHFGLRVESIEDAKKELIRIGIANQDVEITQGRTGPRYFFISDPDGILVEIAEDSREL
ncbi:glyoxalase/bleomycin resistance/dioxygenase family protein [Candidatus Saccharibacteria bacterium]|nr:MAG: glyoxalase/bleomycin resistance/dioxygenase family protein [Candidatus Saccharibacteria bacterium]